MSDFKALGKQIILLVDTGEEMTTESGIIVATDDSSKQYHGVWGEIISVGTDVKNREVGERCMFNKYDAIPFRFGKEDYQCTREDLILAIDPTNGANVISE